MKENSQIICEPNWKITSDYWITCSKCDFAVLMPLVAMTKKEPDNLKAREAKKSLLGKIRQIFKPREEGDGILGFMSPYSKFCKKCKAVYISKLIGGEAIKLKNKYWEKFKPNPSGDFDYSSDFVLYLNSNTKHIDIFKKERCECGGSLIAFSHKCPVCNEKLKISKKEVRGIPITMGNFNISLPN
ncbi:MAG: hypothetical protein KKE50_00090 [Nanoarchaeota archaeon]|nr:hypothetical protein [Nanoarchaeota archaeon]